VDARGAQGVVIGDGNVQVNYFGDRPRTPRVDSVAGQQVEALLAGLQVPGVLQGLVARARGRRWVSVTGPAGSGKSTLLAALTRPERCDGLVPDGFVHAVVFLDRTATGVWLAGEVRDQLRDSVPGHTDAVAACRDADPVGWDRLDPLEQ
jgi:hypothetical protein